MKLLVLLTLSHVIVSHMFLLTSATNNCSPGKYPSDNDPNSCDVCQVGHYCPLLDNNIPESGTIQAGCPPGTYQPNEGQTSIQNCLTCPAGYICDDPSKAPLPRSNVTPLGMEDRLLKDLVVTNTTTTPAVSSCVQVPCIPTTCIPISTVTIPTFTTFTVTIPTFPTGTITTPTLTTFTVTAPAFTTFTVTTPTFPTGTITVPTFAPFTVTMPVFTTPIFTTPVLTTVTLTTPTFPTVTATMPVFTIPIFTIPTFTTMTIPATIPTFTTATITIPTITVTCPPTTCPPLPCMATTTGGLVTTETITPTTTQTVSLVPVTQTVSSTATTRIDSSTSTNTVNSSTSAKQTVSSTATTQSASSSATTTQTASSTGINATGSSPTLLTTTSQNVTDVTTQSIINNYYVQFSFPLNVADGNLSDDQLTAQLRSIFMNALGILSNQIEIVINARTLRSRAITAQVRLFGTASTSADNLLSSTRTQLADSNSKLRQANLTSQLHENSLTDIKQYYICSNGVTQESPCASSDSSNSGTKLSTILLATIIPTAFVFSLIIIAGLFVIKRRSSSFRPERLLSDRF